RVRKEVDVFLVGVRDARGKHREELVDRIDHSPGALGGGMYEARVTSEPTPSSTHVQPFGQRGSGPRSTPLAERCDSTAGMTSPWLHITAPGSRCLRTSVSTASVSPPSARDSSTSTGSPRAPASGTTVSMQRT